MDNQKLPFSKSELKVLKESLEKYIIDNTQKYYRGQIKKSEVSKNLEVAKNMISYLRELQI